MVDYMQDVAHKDAEVFATSIKEITPVLASEMLATMKYEHQRPVSPAHVKMLAAEMRASRFVPGTAIRIAHVNGASMLIDGQHRLGAVVASGIPQTFTIIEESAPSNEYVAWAYGSLDIGKRRVASDLYKAMELPDRLGLSSRALNNLAAAVSFLHDGMKPSRSSTQRVDRAERIRLVELYAPHMREFLRIVSGAEKAISSAAERSYVIAVAMLTIRFSLPYAQSRAVPDIIDFWRGVAFDDKIAVDDPRKHVNRHLLTTSMASLRNAVGVRSVTTASYGARYIAVAFNTYMTRETRKFIRVADETAPVVIYGVPRDTEAWLK